MRVSREAAAETKARVVEVASRMLRERGLDAASIADIMHAAGMTHGGFYKHFKSKNDLVCEAVRFAFDEITKRFDRREATSGRDAALAGYVEEYLSAAHIAHAGAGCPVAALGADAGRNSGWLGAEFSDGTEQLIRRIGQTGEAASDDDEHHGRAAAIRTLTQLVGAVVVARAVGPGRLRDELLAACADLRLSK
jgi:TetR/AcrR family transcriptional repressor of nem operon